SLNEIVATAAAAQVRYNTVGIGEVTNLENEIFVYPNPVASVVNVCVSNPITGFARIGLYDVYGHLVTTQSYMLTTKSTIKIDVSTLSRGVYFLQLTTNQLNKTIKINIQND
ncbi:MAG TPA: T9SS type A sorting domain-containing protein, partial [Bacteroidia bacterium]|nr:T9SS type A sorting domain-containing protein [Bacteroidia bacterium]